MTRATFQALQDTVLGASLGEQDRSFIEQAGAKFLRNSIWKVVLTSLRLPPAIPHPGVARDGARRAKSMRGVAERVLASARASGAEGDELLQRLVTARDPATRRGHARSVDRRQRRHLPESRAMRRPRRR